MESVGVCNFACRQNVGSNDRGKFHISIGGGGGSGGCGVSVSGNVICPKDYDISSNNFDSTA